MGIKQNLKVWDTTATYLDENGVTVTRKIPRELPPAPWKLLGLLTWRSWVFWFVGLAAWIADGYDFNAVNLVATNIAAQYNVDLTHVTLSVTLTLLFRAIGATIFGLASDMYGRKWVMAANMWILAALQVATAYAGSFRGFIGVRAVFGIAMGGVWGLSAAMALENMPVEARGIFGGLLQNGYGIGYILAAMVNIVAVPATDQGYKMIFFVGASYTALIAVIVMCIPESAIFIQATNKPKDTRSAAKRVSLFWHDARLASRQYWKMFLYSVLFCSAYNWMSHATQDIYPSYVKVQKGFTSKQASLATITGQCGAVIGGTTAGYYSQFFGRRLTSIACVIIAFLFIPLFTLPNDFSAIVAGTFFLQMMVNAAWGIMPAILNEWSPPQFRGAFPGTVYQLGNVFSAPAAESQTAAASAWIRDEKPNYNQVMTIFMCVIFSVVIIVCACGPEMVGSHFEVIKRAGHEENIVRGEKELGIHGELGVRPEERSDEFGEEKKKAESVREDSMKE
ncbi:major facilitator superfamily domain-containing protein [Mycena galopus ATCC 62051]|nr:major facilitator superfamily domain-containing protein [Mycena galopus ATCC 62051]